MPRHADLSRPRKYQVEQLRDAHQEIIRRAVLGDKTKDIAADMGVTNTVVSYVRHSNLGRKMVDELEAKANDVTVEIMRDVKEMAHEALKQLNGIRQDERASLGLKAKICMDLLDRAGAMAPTKVEQTHLTAHLNSQDIEELKNRGRAAGVIVDLEPQANEVSGTGQA